MVSIGTQPFEKLDLGSNPWHVFFYVWNRYFSDINRFWAPFMTSLRLLRLLLRHSYAPFIFVGPPMQNGHFGGLETSISLNILYVFFSCTYQIIFPQNIKLYFFGPLDMFDCFWNILTFLKTKSARMAIWRGRSPNYKMMYTFFYRFFVFLFISCIGFKWCF